MDSSDQIYTTGSVCKIATMIIDGSEYIGHLRAEIRLEIDTNKYKNHEGPLMYVSGKTLKNDNIMEVGSTSIII